MNRKIILTEITAQLNQFCSNLDKNYLTKIEDLIMTSWRLIEASSLHKTEQELITAKFKQCMDLLSRAYAILD